MAPQEVTCLLLVVALAAPAPVLAQSKPDPSTLDVAEREELGRLFKRAQSAYEAKNYGEAIAALRAAHGVFPEPNILYRIGDAYENLGDLKSAAEFYRQYVEAAPKASDAGLVRRRIDDLERRTAELEAALQPTEPERAALLLDSNPAGATVLLDASEIERSTPVRVELAPGLHNIELRRDGFVPVVREIEVGAGETISLVYQLEALPEPEVRTRSAWPWVITSVGIASIGASAGLLLGAQSAQKRVDAWDAERLAAYENGGDVLPRPEAYDGTVRRAEAFRTAGYVTGGVGVAAAIGGVIWLLLRGGGDSASVGYRPDGVTLSVRF